MFLIVLSSFSTEVFGWLYLGNVTDPESGDDYPLANLGLKDQRLAMKFIYENIEQFGGDPNRVRIVKMKRPALVEWLFLVVLSQWANKGSLTMKMAPFRLCTDIRSV